MQRYKVIYADPPWAYHVWKKKGAGRTAESHYPTMSIQDICNLPINEIADNDCALFLWVTFPNLPHAFDVIKAWGFVYKTVAFVWTKRNKKSNDYFFGLGHWTRANAEICLLATKGNPKRVRADVRQIIDAPIEKHSQKPNDARTRIIQLMGDVPRIELFARTSPAGWHVWGNEVDSNIALTFDK